MLGDQATLPMMAPDGFTGYPALQQLPQAEGLYLSFTGLTVDQLKAAGGSAAKLLDAYKAEYGPELTSSFALYGVAATQVILAAIEKSDGTRKSVTDAVFTGEGITIPADKSLDRQGGQDRPDDRGHHVPGHLDPADEGWQGDVPEGPAGRLRQGRIRVATRGQVPVQHPPPGLGVGPCPNRCGPLTSSQPSSPSVRPFQ